MTLSLSLTLALALTLTLTRTLTQTRTRARTRIRTRTRTRTLTLNLALTLAPGVRRRRRAPSAHALLPRRHARHPNPNPNLYPNPNQARAGAFLRGGDCFPPRARPPDDGRVRFHVGHKPAPQRQRECWPLGSGLWPAPSFGQPRPTNRFGHTLVGRTPAISPAANPRPCSRHRFTYHGVGYMVYWLLRGWAVFAEEMTDWLDCGTSTT